MNTASQRGHSLDARSTRSTRSTGTSQDFWVSAPPTGLTPGSPSNDCFSGSSVTGKVPGITGTDPGTNPGNVRGSADTAEVCAFDTRLDAQFAAFDERNSSNNSGNNSSNKSSSSSAAGSSALVAIEPRGIERESRDSAAAAVDGSGVQSARGVRSFEAAPSDAETTQDGSVERAGAQDGSVERAGAQATQGGGAGVYTGMTNAQQSLATRLSTLETLHEEGSVAAMSSAFHMPLPVASVQREIQAAAGTPVSH